MGEIDYFDCPQCGEIGQAQDLKEHPTRPCPTDIGFCPACGAGQDYTFTRREIETVIRGYGENPNEVLEQIDEGRTW